MAGTDPRFNATKFRDAIHFAMNMGLPGDTSLRAKFRWPTARDYAREDVKGYPYDWTSTPTSDTTHADVEVMVAVEYPATETRTGNVFTPGGEYNEARATITLLDEDYAQVVGATKVLLGTNPYTIEYVAPPIGLFDVTVYQMFLTADDES